MPCCPAQHTTSSHWALTTGTPEYQTTSKSIMVLKACALQGYPVTKVSKPFTWNHCRRPSSLDPAYPIFC